ncbi:MAG: hypothetical protein ACR2HG_08055 [Pyrinomonadaceae bacterium]
MAPDKVARTIKVHATFYFTLIFYRHFKSSLTFKCETPINNLTVK